MSARVTFLGLVVALLAAGCGDDGGAAPTTLAPPPPAPVATTTAPPNPEDGDTAVGEPPRYDPSLTRMDVDCNEAALEEGGTDEFVTAHYVVDGVLGAVCFGEEDPALIQTWELLATITPPDQLRPLALLAGFDSPDADTAAFVTVVGDRDGLAFQMAMNLPFAEAADPEFALTIAHEFSHVLAGQVDQLDRTADPAGCATFDNGEGCALPGSYLDEWVAEFWSEEELASLDVTVDDLDAAEARCNLNPGFLGAYAATNPDEDFAESFAAFVFRVEVETPQLEEKMEFFATRPELAEYRRRAEAAGLAGLPNEFDACG